MPQTAPVYNAQEKVWSNPANGQKSVDVPLGEFLLNELARHGDQLIQINHDTGERTTCTEIRLKSLKVAENLEKIGIQRGDHVSIIANHRSDVMPLYVGIIAYGAVLNFLFFESTAYELAHLFKIIQPKLIICDAEGIAKVTKSLENLSIDPMIYAIAYAKDNVRSTEEFFRNYDTVPSTFRLPQIADLHNTKALILNSSGSTGLPKCVLISHAMILSGIRNASIAYDGQLWYNAVAPHGISSVFEIPSCVLLRSPRIITAQPLTADLVLEVLQKYDVKGVLMYPFNVATVAKRIQMDNYDLSKLKKIVTGGSALSEVARITLNKKLPNVEIGILYGMTEIGYISISNTKTKQGSVGFLFAGTSGKIVDDLGNELDPGESGEICIKQNYSFLGYLNNEEATRNAIHADGWFRSGDIGYFDTDGELFVTGRKTDMIKYKAIKIAPFQLEDFVRKQFNVQDIAVVGVPAEDDLGQLPAAVVVLPSNSTVTEADITKGIEEKFADVKHLRGGVFFVKTLPQANNGKVQRSQVEQIATALYQAKNKQKLI